MTVEDYISQHRTDTFKRGDKVIIHSCLEAVMPKNKGKTFTCKTDSFRAKSGEEVVFLDGFSGYFSTEFLKPTDN